jgi:hypothetical protein
MPGRKELRNIRFRHESGGNGVVSTGGRYIFRGNGEMINDDREVTEVEELVGVFGGTDRTYIAQLGASLKLAETPATFEQLSDLFIMAGLGTSGGGNLAGSAQGASGSTAVFTLIVPSTAAPITYSYTTEAGNGTNLDGWTETMEYTLCEELTLKFGGGEAMMVSASLFGRQGTATNRQGSFSNVGTIPAVETILASRGSFWLSPSGSGWGTNAMTAGNILAGEVTIKTAWTKKFPVDAGNLYFHTAVYTGCEITGELTLEGQRSGTLGVWGSVGQKEKWRNQESLLLTATWRGGAITEGTTYTSKEFTMQLPFKWKEMPAVDDIDNNDIVTGKFFSKFGTETPAAGRGSVIIARYGTSEFAGA